MAGVRLKRLKIHAYRNVAPGTELHFGDGFNVLLGKNGTGKTTLLRLIAMILTGKLMHLAEEDFAIEHELSIEALALSVTLRNEPRRAGARPGAAWSYGVTVRLAEATSGPPLCVVSANADGATLRLAGERGSGRQCEEHAPFEGNFLREVLCEVIDVIEDEDDELDDAAEREPALFSLQEAADALESLEENGGRFDEGLAAFDALTGVTLHEGPGDVDWAYLGVDLKGERVVVGYSTFVPAPLREAVGARSAGDFVGEEVRFPHDTLGFLRSAVEVLGFRGATLVAPLKKKEESERGHGLTYNDFVLRCTLADGTAVAQDQLGYGEKRVVSFFYYAACNPDVIVADELANGLHHEQIQACLEEVRGRQCFLSSPNAVLLDTIALGAAEDAEQTFVLCAREAREGRDRVAWKNMSDERVEGFLRAYETHALQASEILRAFDLW